MNASMSRSRRPAVHTVPTVAASLGATLLGLLGSVCRADPPPEIVGPDSRLQRVFSEECDQGDLDARWIFEDGRQDDRAFIQSSRWRSNVDARSGLCQITLRKEERLGKPWTAGHGWTRQEFRYGWFEARLRFTPAPGVDNAFWLMSVDRSRSPGQPSCEIDVIEGGEPDIATLNLHVIDDQGHRQDPYRAPRIPRDAQGYATYAVWWTPEFIRWYWNGQLVRERPNPGCHRPLAVRMSAAVMRSTYWGTVDDRLNGTALVVDYVRVYQAPPR